MPTYSFTVTRMTIGGIPFFEALIYYNEKDGSQSFAHSVNGSTREVATERAEKWIEGRTPKEDVEAEDDEEQGPVEPLILTAEGELVPDERGSALGREEPEDDYQDPGLAGDETMKEESFTERADPEAVAEGLARQEAEAQAKIWDAAQTFENAALNAGGNSYLETAVYGHPDSTEWTNGGQTFALKDRLGRRDWAGLSFVVAQGFSIKVKVHSDNASHVRGAGDGWPTSRDGDFLGYGTAGGGLWESITFWMRGGDSLGIDVEGRYDAHADFRLIIDGTTVIDKGSPNNDVKVTVLEAQQRPDAGAAREEAVTVSDEGSPLSESLTGDASVLVGDVPDVTEGHHYEVAHTTLDGARSGGVFARFSTDGDISGNTIDLSGRSTMRGGEGYWADVLQVTNAPGWRVVWDVSWHFQNGGDLGAFDDLKDDFRLYMDPGDTMDFHLGPWQGGQYMNRPLRASIELDGVQVIDGAEVSAFNATLGPLSPMYDATFEFVRAEYLFKDDGGGGGRQDDPPPFPTPEEECASKAGYSWNPSTQTCDLDDSPDPDPDEKGFSMFGVVALVAVAVLVIGFLVVRSRRRTPPTRSASPPPTGGTE